MAEVIQKAFLAFVVILIVGGIAYTGVSTGFFAGQGTNVLQGTNYSRGELKADLDRIDPYVLLRFADKVYDENGNDFFRGDYFRNRAIHYGDINAVGFDANFGTLSADVAFFNKTITQLDVNSFGDLNANAIIVLDLNAHRGFIVDLNTNRFVAFADANFLNSVGVSQNLFVGNELWGQDIFSKDTIHATNELYASYLVSNFVGSIDMRADPWELVGTGLGVSGKLRVDSDSNFTNVGVSGNAFLKNVLIAKDLNATTIRATGDINGVNVGISGFYFGDGSKLTGLNGDANHTASTSVPQNAFLSNVNVAKDLNVAGSLRVSGTILGTDSNFSNVGVSGNAFLSNVNVAKDLNVQGNLSVSGTTLGVDSNFTNVGVSQNTFLKNVNVAKDLNVQGNVWAKQDLNITEDINAGGTITGAKFRSWDANEVNGLNAIAFGYKTTARGNQSAAFGHSTTASGTFSSAFGYRAVATGWASFVSVYNDGGTTNTSGIGSAIIGSNSAISGSSVLTASGTGSIILGHSEGIFANVAKTASGAGSMATGYNSGTMTASGNGSNVGGYTGNGLTVASGSGSTATGYNTGTMTSSTFGSIIMGANTGSMTASGYGSTIIGYNGTGQTTTSGHGSIAMGYNSGGVMTAFSNGGIVIGYAESSKNLLSYGTGAVSMGFGAKSFGTGSISIGYDTNANAEYATAIGYQTMNNKTKSVALGLDVNVAQDLNVMRNLRALGAISAGNGLTQTLVIGTCLIDVNAGIITKAVGC